MFCNKSKKRIKGILAIIFIIFASLLIRLYYLQVMNHNDFLVASKTQWKVSISGIPKSFDKPIYYYCIPKSDSSKYVYKLTRALHGKLVNRENYYYDVIMSEEYDDKIDDTVVKLHQGYTFVVLPDKNGGNGKGYYIYADCKGKFLNDCTLQT